MTERLLVLPGEKSLRGKTVEEIDLFEINEALAAVALISSKLAYIDKEKINVKGMRS